MTILFPIPKLLITCEKHLSIKDKQYIYIYLHISYIHYDQQFSMRDVCNSILLHMIKFGKVLKYNLIKIWRPEHFVKSMFNDYF